MCQRSRSLKKRIWWIVMKVVTQVIWSCKKICLITLVSKKKKTDGPGDPVKSRG